MHKLSAGEGYTYLTKQVAVQDQKIEGRTKLELYYSERGEAPGVWVGKGLAGLKSETVFVGSLVSEDQMRALFGEGLRPDADIKINEFLDDNLGSRVSVDRAINHVRLGAKFNDGGQSRELTIRFKDAYRNYNLGVGRRANASIDDEVRAEIRTEVAGKYFLEKYLRPVSSPQELNSFIARESRPRPVSVSGYDVTFSPVKSVSLLWALAPVEVSELVQASHNKAVSKAVEWIEDHILFTREGAGSVRQVDCEGLMAAQFIHRESRSGDPDLHTHVAISNRVQTRSGKWLSVDGKALYRGLVAASEVYNSAVECELIKELGVRFAARVPVKDGKRVVREIVGFTPEVLAGFSKRRKKIDERITELSAKFLADHGRVPTPIEAINLAQQANLETRTAKPLSRSFLQQRADWREEANTIVGSSQGVDAMVNAILSVGNHPRTGIDVHELAGRVVAKLEESRAVFNEHHIFAETQRQVREFGLVDGHDQMVNKIINVVKAEHVLKAGEKTGVHELGMFRRRSGESVYTRAYSQLFTTQKILDCEQRLVSLAADRGGKFLNIDLVNKAIAANEKIGFRLTDSQREMIKNLSCSGLKIQLALSPGGTGKTRAMGILADIWKFSGSNVVGLCPTAVAASELREALGGDSDTVARLAWEIDHNRSGVSDRIGAGTLVIIDEAGMVGTVELAKVCDYITTRGGVVRFIGDDKQLSAVGAGGVLRDIAEEIGAVTLTEVIRFKDPLEATATLALREGDGTILGYYLDNDRVNACDENTGVKAVVNKWVTDQTKNKSSVMIAANNEQVVELNAMAQQWRAENGLLGAEHVQLTCGLNVYAGDLIITRCNDRKLRLTRSDWAKNRDLWTVTAVCSDGGLRVKHADTRRVIKLPADYVSQFVELGYACTVHGVQGRTVDRSHALVDGSWTRNQLYVAMSRGREINDMEVVVTADNSLDSIRRVETVAPLSAVEVLAQVITNRGGESSASSIIRDSADPKLLLADELKAYRDARSEVIIKRMGLRWVEEITELASHVPNLVESNVWRNVLGDLAEISWAGYDAKNVLNEIVNQRGLDDAKNNGAVIESRLETSRYAKNLSTTKSGVLWEKGIPHQLIGDKVVGVYLKTRLERVRLMVEKIKQSTRELTDIELPMWAKNINDRDLVADLMVWQAATGHVPIPIDNLLGDKPQRKTQLDYYINLANRLDIAELDKDKNKWLEKLPAQVSQDRYWPLVYNRLNKIAEKDLASLLDKHLQKPLPTENAACALWYRVMDEVEQMNIKESRYAPSWIKTLKQYLPEDNLPILSKRKIAGIDELLNKINCSAEVAFEWASKQSENSTDIERWLNVLANEPEHENFVPPPEENPPESNWQIVTPPVSVSVWDTPAERVSELTAQANKFFTQKYSDSPAQKYLQTRLGSDIEKYGFIPGYAPNSPDSLINHLKTFLQASNQELIDAGLAKYTAKGKLIDVFRNRVILPIRDKENMVVGFVGRDLSGINNIAKYINSPSTPIYIKGHNLFGLAEQKEALKKGALPVRVEGAIDAIAVTKTDTNMVGLAPLGTALTDEQAELLSQITDPDQPIYLALDNDLAGQKALAKDYEKLSVYHGNIRKLFIPDKDPAQAYQQHPQMFIDGLKAANTFSAPVAQTLCDQIIDQCRDRLDDVNMQIHATWQLGKIIASANPEDWDELIMNTGQQLAPDEPGYGQTLLLNETTKAVVSWMPPETRQTVKPATTSNSLTFAERLQQIREHVQQEKQHNRWIQPQTSQNVPSRQQDTPTQSL